MTLPSAAEVLRRVPELPSVPAVALEVLRLTREEDVSLEELAEAISRDPALAGKLLRFANSPLFNPGSEVTSIQRAALVLGLKSVQLMSLSFSLTSGLRAAGAADVEGFDHEGFWRRSLARAVAGRALAARAGALVEDEAFLCGLLGDVGQLALAIGFEEYGEVLARAGGALPTPALEREVLGFDHADVGQALLASWRLPPVLALAVGAAARDEDPPAEAPALARELTSIARAARAAADLLCGGDAGAALARLEELARASLGLPAQEVHALVLALEGDLREAAEILDVPADGGRSHAEVLAEAREEMLRLGMLGQEIAPDLSHRDRIASDRERADRVTGLVDAHGLRRYLDAEVRVRLATRRPRSLGLLLLRIRDWDGLVERHGEAEACEALRLVAGVLRSLLRRDDLAARAGDGRFAIVVPECVAFGLRALAERVRRGVAAHAFRLGDGSGDVDVEVVVGGACLSDVRDPRDGAALLEIAERYLERAARPGATGCEVPARPVRRAG